MNSILTYIQYIALHFRRHTHTVDLKRDWKPQFYSTEPSYIEFKMYKSFLYFISLISGSFTHQYWGCREVSIWDMNNTFTHNYPNRLSLIQELHVGTAFIFQEQMFIVFVDFFCLRFSTTTKKVCFKHSHMKKTYWIAYINQ